MAVKHDQSVEKTWFSINPASLAIGHISSFVGWTAIFDDFKVTMVTLW